MAKEDRFDLKSIKIPKKILDEVKLIQTQDFCPVKSNDMMIIAIAVFRFINSGYILESDQALKKFYDGILDDIDIMKKDDFLDPNTRGYERRK